MTTKIQKDTEKHHIRTAENFWKMISNVYNNLPKHHEVVTALDYLKTGKINYAGVMEMLDKHENAFKDTLHAIADFYREEGFSEGFHEPISRLAENITDGDVTRQEEHGDFG